MVWIGTLFFYSDIGSRMTGDAWPGAVMIPAAAAVAVAREIGYVNSIFKNRGRVRVVIVFCGLRAHGVSCVPHSLLLWLLLLLLVFSSSKRNPKGKRLWWRKDFEKPRRRVIKTVRDVITVERQRKSLRSRQRRADLSTIYRPTQRKRLSVPVNVGPTTCEAYNASDF